MADSGTAETNRAHVAEMYAAYARQGPQAVMDLLSDDVVWQSLGDEVGPWSGRRVGKSAVGTYFQELGAAFEILAYDIERILADEEWATVLATVTVRRRADASVGTYPKVDVLHFAAGRLVEFREYYDTAAVVRHLEGAGRSA